VYVAIRFVLVDGDSERETWGRQIHVGWLVGGARPYKPLPSFMCQRFIINQTTDWVAGFAAAPPEL